MNISQFKTKVAQERGIALPALNLVRGLEQNTNAPTPWLSHWDNEKRVRIVMHEDVAKAIKDNPKLNGIAAKYELVAAAAERLEYHQYVVILPTNIEMSF